jgi:hypothetical protein
VFKSEVCVFVWCEREEKFSALKVKFAIFFLEGQKGTIISGSEVDIQT